jgi:hypothetical protein
MLSMTGIYNITMHLRIGRDFSNVKVKENRQYVTGKMALKITLVLCLAGEEFKQDTKI